VLLYFRRVAHEDSLSHDATGTFWSALSNQTIEILSALQQLQQQQQINQMKYYQNQRYLQEVIHKVKVKQKIY
jgi:hypothetical protein